MLSPQGIFKPAVLPEIPLSITTVPVVEGKSRPYEDEIGPDGRMRYKYRGTDPMHRDNMGLRLAMQRQTPLIYFYGLVPGRYAAIWPVHIIGENQSSLSFSVEVEDKRNLIVGEQAVLSESIAQPESAARAYITVATQVRLHQHSFRMRVLEVFSRFFEVVRAGSDQCTPFNPFFYLRSEEFWHLHPQPGWRQSSMQPVRLEARDFLCRWCRTQDCHK